MTHLEDMKASFAAAQVGWIHPTYTDPINGQTKTLLTRRCLGSIAGPHTAAAEDQGSMAGILCLLHESGSTSDDLAAAYSDAIAGDHDGLNDAFQTRASFRTELASCSLAWNCPEGEIVLNDYRDQEVVATSVGVTVREYYQKGIAKGQTHAQLATALRDLVGDPHSDPQSPVAPDSTAFDEIMS